MPVARSAACGAMMFSEPCAPFVSGVENAGARPFAKGRLSLTRSLTHSPTHPLTHSPTHPGTHPPTHPPKHARMHSLTQSLTHYYERSGNVSHTTHNG